MDLFNLHDKVAIVTGGNRGLGRGRAVGLASAGAHIVIAARNQAKTATTAAELRARAKVCRNIPSRRNQLTRHICGRNQRVKHITTYGIKGKNNLNLYELRK